MLCTTVVFSSIGTHNEYMCDVTDRLIATLPCNAVGFLAFFMRFEFALKRGDFLKQNTCVAEPDWDKFANSLGADFLESVRKHARTLIDLPPKKLDHQLRWQETRVHDVQTLFAAVRRVRNNLFHGEKFFHELSGDSDRDVKLVEEALGILKAALNCSDKVKTHFKLPSG